MDMIARKKRLMMRSKLVDGQLITYDTVGAFPVIVPEPEPEEPENPEEPTEPVEG